MKLNFGRAIVAVWLLSVALWGFSGFDDSSSGVNVRIPATADAPARTEAIGATFRCAAPLKSNAEPKVKGDVGQVISINGTPCAEDRQRRRRLVAIDAALGLALLAASFVPLGLILRRRTRMQGAST